MQVEYGPAVDWAKISKFFFRKEKEYAMQAQERREKVEKELEVERTYVTYSSVDSRTGSVMQVKAPLKQQLTKEEVLEVYLNTARFGRSVVGVEAAARHYFGVSAAQLTPAQAARLAAMVPNPRFYDRNRGSRWLASYTDIILSRMPRATVP
jgi:monofunctional biosynthetic peptidoglycan transglycosylase